jgi:hypothetical protein
MNRSAVGAPGRVQLCAESEKMSASTSILRWMSKLCKMSQALAHGLRVDGGCCGVVKDCTEPLEIRCATVDHEVNLNEDSLTMTTCPEGIFARTSRVCVVKGTVQAR